MTLEDAERLADLLIKQEAIFAEYKNARQAGHRIEGMYGHAYRLISAALAELEHKLSPKT